MADKKISQLTAATTPLTGTETLPIVQGGQTVKATAQDIANLAGGSYLYVGDSSVDSSIDWSQAKIQELNLDNNPTLLFSNGVSGSSYDLLLKQTEAGQKSITWPNSVKWSGNTEPSLIAVPGPGAVNPFTIGTGFNGNVNVVNIQPDGKILVGGSFGSYNGTSCGILTRLNADGTLDSSFTNLSWHAPSGTPEIFAIELFPDGSMLVGGNIGGNFSFQRQKWIQKINADGSYSFLFIPLDGIVRAIKRQSDDKIVIGGDFSNVGMYSSPAIARLNSNGSYDTSFVASASGSVYAIEIQSDGKILIGGTFSSVNPMGTTVSAYGIARLLTTGAYDTSFNTGTKLIYGMGGVGSVYAVTLQSDGKVLLGGNFNNYNGTTVYNILRLNSDASLDTTFSDNKGANSTVRSISIAQNNKIVVCGMFNSYYYPNGSTSIPANGIALISSVDSSFDTSFGTGLGTGASPVSVYTSAVQTDGKIIVGGDFTTINSINNSKIARIDISASGESYYNKVSFDYNGTYYIGSF